MGGTYSGRGAAGCAAARRWRTGLAVLAGLVLLTVTGCAGADWQGVSASRGVVEGAGPGGGTSAVGYTTQGGSGLAAGSGAPGASQPPGTTPGSQPVLPPGTSPGTPGGPSGVTGSVMFGGDVPLVAQQPRLGRKLAIVRIYDLIGQHFPSRRDARLMAAGSTLLISLDTYPHTGPSYAAIAAGREDGTISSFLNSVEQAAVTYRLPAIYVTFEHEANNASRHTGLGSPADFVRAWDHVHALAISAHLDWNQGGRLHWVLILTHRGYLNGSAAQYWPGNGEADIIGADGYNTGGCRHAGPHSQPAPPVTPASLFGKVVSFARSHGRMPVFIPEWGSVEYPSPGVRVNFIRQMQAFVAANPEIRAAMYWDSKVPGCNYEINNSAASLAALASMGHAPNMQG